MKNIYPNESSEEFFERKNRRHAIWKSEAEYKAFVLDFAGGGQLLNRFEVAMEATAKYLVKNTDLGVIDDKLIKKVKNELDELESITIDQKTREVQRNQKQDILKVMNCLKKYSEEKNIECNFVILMASQFNSGFSKPDFSATNIVFKTIDGEKIAKFGDIGSSLNAKEKQRSSFFYLFYKRKDCENTDIDNDEICKRLFKEFF